MADWLKECEICDEALCNEFRRLLDEGQSQREAAAEMVKQQMEALEAIGHKPEEPPYTAEAIRQRYLYHSGKVKRKETGKAELKLVEIQQEQPLADVVEIQPEADAEEVVENQPAAVAVQEDGVTEEASEVWTTIYDDLSNVQARIREQLRTDDPPTKDVAKKIVNIVRKITKDVFGPIQKAAGGS